MNTTLVETASSLTTEGQPMSTRVASNGFGRIGRAVLRSAIERNADVDIVAVNEIAHADALAHLTLDSIYGRFAHPVRAENGALVVAGRRIEVLTEHDPRALLPWGGARCRHRQVVLLRDLRRALDDGRRRHADQGHRLVRQRLGLHANRLVELAERVLASVPSAV